MTEVRFISRSDWREERAVELPTEAFPDDIVAERAVISGAICISIEMSRKRLQYKLSACETIARGRVPAPSVTTQNLFQPECVCCCTTRWSVARAPRGRTWTESIIVATAGEQSPI